MRVMSIPSTALCGDELRRVSPRQVAAFTVFYKTYSVTVTTGQILNAFLRHWPGRISRDQCHPDQVMKSRDKRVFGILYGRRIKPYIKPY